MANEAPNWYVSQFVDSAVHIHQAKGYMLKGTTSAPVKVDGKTLTWQIAGKGEAEPLQRGSFGPAMNAGRSNVSATMADYQANEWCWETDLEKMTVDEQSVIAKTCGMAIGRKSDMLIINELNATSATIVDLTDGGNIAAASAPFSLVAALAGQTLLAEQDAVWDDGEVFCGLPPKAWQQLMSYKQVNNSDWVGADGLPYVSGTKYKSWNGVRWFMIPISYAPVFGTNIHDFFMWHKNAIGAGGNYDLRSNVTWENLYSGWYHNNRFAAAVKTLLPTGVIRFRYGATSAISVN